MKPTLIFVFLISACLAQQEESAAPQRAARAPQGHIQYSDPDGLKVSWKLYAPYSQWKSHLENPERNQRAESGTAQPSLAPRADLIQPAAATEQKAVPVQPVHQVQVQYKPYSMVPTHIKQLILEMYEPQGPYVDPSVYIYRAAQQSQEQEEQPQKQETPASEQEESNQATSQTQLNTAQARYEHVPKYYSKYPLKAKVGFIQYKDEQPTAEATATPQYGAVPERRAAEEQQQQQEQQQEQQQQEQQQQQQQRSSFDDGMPKALHELLNLQAQTPYHVIANRIIYKPKSIFVPKPFTDEVKGTYKYRSKIYYIKDEEEEPKNNERPEREEPKDQMQEEEPEQE